ncbi:MAG: hypothetical protein JRF54_08760 [Deltaproteobacteria bacterium]|nr:hypothetical protein [Deltaproteobacteria bacterium]
MRFTSLIALLVWAPSIASAQQDQAVVNRVLGNVPELVTSTVDAELAPGTIAVEVVDATGNSVSKQAIRLGLMEQSGGRESKACVTDEMPTCRPTPSIPTG